MRPLLPPLHRPQHNGSSASPRTCSWSESRHCGTAPHALLGETPAPHRRKVRAPVTPPRRRTFGGPPGGRSPRTPSRFLAMHVLSGSPVRCRLRAPPTLWDAIPSLPLASRAAWARAAQVPACRLPAGVQQRLQRAWRASDAAGAQQGRGGGGGGGRGVTMRAPSGLQVVTEQNILSRKRRGLGRSHGGR